MRLSREPLEREFDTVTARASFYTTAEHLLLRDQLRQMSKMTCSRFAERTEVSWQSAWARRSSCAWNSSDTTTPSPLRASLHVYAHLGYPQAPVIISRTKHAPSTFPLHLRTAIAVVGQNSYCCCLPRSHTYTTPLPSSYINRAGLFWR
jgi:hypothetical protein